MNPSLFSYRGKTYPDYLRRGNAMQFIEPVALKFCQGRGLDIGAGNWPFSDAKPIDPSAMWDGRWDAMQLPPGKFDYIFSSHCLEHLANPVEALERWKSHIRPGGVLFLYLPHPDMEYWRPENCRKHRHLFWPKDIAAMLAALGFENILQGERDLVWSFAVVAFKGEESE